MNKKICAVFGILAGFIALYIVAMDNYLIEWLARRYFCLLWLPVIIGVLMDKRKFATTFLLGILGAMPVAQLLENAKYLFYDNNDPYAHSIIIGIPAYFLIVIVCAVIGVLRERSV